MEICIKLDQPGSGGILDILKEILHTQIQIMALIDDVKAELAALKVQSTDLQTSLDAEQAQIAVLLETNAAVVTGLNNQIATLTEQLANSANPIQLQEVIDGIIAIRDGLATTKTDLEGTIADA